MLDLTADPDTLALLKALMQSHWRGVEVAETAALDQIRAHLSPEGTRNLRALDLTHTAVLFAASALVRMATTPDPPKWEECGSLTDPLICEAVSVAIEVELLLPGTGAGMIGVILAGQTLDGTVAVIREAAWLASSLSAQCLLAS